MLLGCQLFRETLLQKSSGFGIQGLRFIRNIMSPTKKYSNKRTFQQKLFSKIENCIFGQNLLSKMFFFLIYFTKMLTIAYDGIISDPPGTNNC